VQHPPHRRPRRRFTIGFVIVAMVLAAAAVGAAAYAFGRSSTTPSDSSAASACAVRSVADNVLPSVVTISANGATGAGTGSGEVIRTDGSILTNNHVISGAANGGSVDVLFSDGTSVPATITGRDILTDLAVLKVDPPFDLTAIKIGQSSSVHVGQPVVALGAPLGLSGTVTAGIVSALDRMVNVPADHGATAIITSAIQTDASINPGNSGGALVNCGGQLVAVPTAGAAPPGGGGGSVGLGFAIPVDFAMDIANQLIEHGTVTHATVGLEAVPIPPSAAASAGTPQGLFVQAVATGGPAADAGIQPGDVITKIDGEDATSSLQIETLTLTKNPGDTVEIDYWREGQTATATVTLGRASPT
jgi:putative serine protease PepD